MPPKAEITKDMVVETAYLMKVDGQSNFMLGIGLNYIRFAIQEPYLFRFLFQSGYAVGNNL